MTRVRIGSKIRITSDNENYKDFFDKVLTVTNIATSVEQHQGYDNSVNSEDEKPMQLVDCEGFDCSIYEYEFEVAKF